jgi:hypothetical protein
VIGSSGEVKSEAVGYLAISFPPVAFLSVQTIESLVVELRLFRATCFFLLHPITRWPDHPILSGEES